MARRLPGFPDARPADFALLLTALVWLVPAVAAGAAASYGESQLKAILEDRPQLSAILMDRPGLQDWLVEELDNDSPKPLWDPSEPVSGRAAEHEYPSRGGTVPEGTALVRVSSMSPGWDQLAGLVFELHNLRHSERFEDIQQAAIAGEIDKSEYVHRLLEQEFTALRATKSFLEENIDDAPESARDEETLFGQILQTEDTLEAHLGKFEKNGNGLTAHFEELYEREVVPRISGQ